MPGEKAFPPKRRCRSAVRGTLDSPPPVYAFRTMDLVHIDTSAFRIPREKRVHVPKVGRTAQHPGSPPPIGW